MFLKLDFLSKVFYVFQMPVFLIFLNTRIW